MEKKTRHYNESECINKLGRDVHIVSKNVTVARQLGIRKLGMLDYLVEQCGYIILGYGKKDGKKNIK